MIILTSIRSHLNVCMGISPMKNIGESVDFSSKKLDNQLLLGKIKNWIKVKIKDFRILF